MIRNTKIKFNGKEIKNPLSRFLIFFIVLFFIGLIVGILLPAFLVLTIVVVCFIAILVAVGNGYTNIKTDKVFNSTETVVHFSSDEATTITVNGKKIDPKSKKGKEIMGNVNKKIRVVEGGMDKVSEALHDMAKNL